MKGGKARRVECCRCCCSVNQPTSHHGVVPDYVAVTGREEPAKREEEPRAKHSRAVYLQLPGALYLE